MSSQRLARRPVSPTPQPDRERAGRGQTVAAVVLGTLLVVGAGASVAGVFDPEPLGAGPVGSPAAPASAAGIAGSGVPLPVPGGQAVLEHVEHVTPSVFGAPLPADSHGVEVTLTVTAEAAAAVTFDSLAVRMSGQGIPQPIAPTSASPAALQLAPGAAGTATVMFAVPDQSTDLLLTLPDGTVVSAEHENHPGDRDQAED